MVSRELRVEGLSAEVAGGFRLDAVDLLVEAGERVAVIGPNGAGKSCLLRLLVGLDRAREGRVSWAGELLTDGPRVVVPPERRPMGMVFQELALFPTRDVAGNVALGLPRGTPRAEAPGLVDRALVVARIGHLRARSVSALSGGEQQRVALARALVRRPEVLLLDEPFHSLDWPVKREILSDLRGLVGEGRIATVLVTHDTEEAMAFADRVVLLRDGRKVQEGPFDDLYRAPADRAAGELLGPVETLCTEAARRAGIALPEGATGDLVAFRREDLHLTRGGRGGEDLEEVLEVVEVRPRGPCADVVVRLPDGSTATARPSSAAAPRAGERVGARVARLLEWSAAGERRAPSS